MLEILKISHFALIDAQEIRFRPGLNILSGETGAGKSIVLDAISLLLGERAQVDSIRKGSQEAIVEGLFQIQNLPEIQKRLEARDLTHPDDPHILVIRRIISRQGKHRVMINSSVATLQVLLEVTDGLIDLCSQHEHQTLVKAATQMNLLDRFSGSSEQHGQLVHHLNQRREIARQLESEGKSREDRERRLDFLNFQIQELDSAGLQIGEDVQLIQERKLLQTAEARIQKASSILATFEGDSTTPGLLESIKSCIQRGRSLLQMDASLEQGVGAIERGYLELEEAGQQLQRYLSQIGFAEDRLQIVADRLAVLGDLKRKYGHSTEEMLKTLEILQRERAGILEADLNQNGLKEDWMNLSEQLRQLGHQLIGIREKGAKKLSALVTQELQDLLMVGARFNVQLTVRDSIDDWTLDTGPQGIEFRISTNTGEAEYPIGKVASGGELSRVMLAIRHAVSDRGGIGVYLFDEIDAGIGGRTAFVVGRKLQSVAAQNQVICITHLPQVAAFADHHLSVQKLNQKDRIQTVVVELNEKSREEELARMLGGEKLSEKTLSNARELVDLASQTAFHELHKIAKNARSREKPRDRSL